VRALLAAALSAATLSCGGSAAAPSPLAAQAVAAPFVSAHFTFFYTTLDTANIGAVAQAVEGEYARILNDLGAGPLPTVQVHFYPDHQALEAAVAPLVGTVPSWASGLATAVDQIHLMSPNHPAYAPLDRMLSNLVHEFAHCASIRVNARIPNNPRWLWESVAIYESGQTADLRTLGYMRDGQVPSFASLNSFDNRQVYELGYSIAEFIVTRWGRDALNKLVLNNANVSATLGVSQTEFEAQWLAFVRQRYNL